MADKTDEAIANLPDFFISLFFQVASVVCIFSMMKLKSFFLGRYSLRIGKLEYLYRDVVHLISEIEVRLLIFSWGVPEE